MNLPHRSNIELKLFDALGKETAILVNGNYDAGSYSFAIPSLSSGIYFGSMKYEGKQMITKLVIP
jgi:hypothetical protein